MKDPTDRVTIDMWPQYGRFCMTRMVIGIDPGLTGAAALISGVGLEAVADLPVMAKGKGSGMVKNEINAAALNEMLRRWVSGLSDEILVVVERVSSMPGQGIASAMSLGDTVGCIRGIVAARGYPIEWVTPQAWKKYFRLPADKEYARARAIELYPEADLSRKKDHGKAEAILIARYGWETLR